MSHIVSRNAADHSPLSPPPISRRAAALLVAGFATTVVAASLIVAKVTVLIDWGFSQL